MDKNYILPLALLLTAVLSCRLAVAEESAMVYDLRCENLTNPVSIDSLSPHFSWKIKSSVQGTVQSKFQIVIATAPSLLNEKDADLWNSGPIESNENVFVPYQGKPLASHIQAWWKVRVWTAEMSSPWSEAARFGVGLLNPADWKAEYITFPEESDGRRTPLLRKGFDWNKSNKRTILHVNSLGYHEVWLNGEKVGDDVLSPAVCQYDKRSLINSYDVTESLREGRNDLVLWLGRGWYNPGLPGCVSNTPVVRAQLEEVEKGDWKILAATDATWLGRNSEYADTGTWRSAKFGGEIIDARKRPANMKTETLDALEWKSVELAKIPEHVVTPQMVQANRTTKTFNPVSVEKIDEGRYLVDMGTCLSGWTEIRFPDMEAGREIVLTYSDYRDKDGILAKQPQEDRYIASGKGNEYFCNKFNYHGYRYILVSNLPEPLDPENISGKLVQTNFAEASSFECSDKDINAIHDMMQYTLRCLSLGGYLVDCPQYERLGYGGDGNSSLQTAQTMYDLSPLYNNWLLAWEDVMSEEGSLPHIAPCPQTAGGGPYWCAFIITASWNTYQHYGDPRPMTRHYEAMRRWLSYVEKYSPDGLLKKWPATEYRNWYLGDWATPKGVDQTLEPTVDLVSNCVIVWSYDTMEKIAAALGKPDDVKEYSTKKSALKKLIQKTFFNTETNGYATDSQIDLIFPMLVDVTPESLKPAIRNRLFHLTETKHAEHLACGLVGLPVLTEWSVRTGETNFMYSMLKKRDYPGFLHMIDNGATTTWEHWDAKRSRIHNCYNSLGPWFYGAIGGIRPDETASAYRRFIVQPQIPEGVDWAKITKETPYGTIRFDWTLENGTMQTELTVPIGSTAVFVFPENTQQYRLNGKLGTIESGQKQLELPSGRYSIFHQAE